MSKIIKCKSEPFICTDTITCMLHKQQLGPAIWCVLPANGYHKDCPICDVQYQYEENTNSRYMSKEQQQQIWKTYGFHNNRKP